jgi:hypothetical protein
MTVAEFISCQCPERQQLLTALHKLILENDKAVTAVVGPMMKQQLIIYNAPGTFKYGLGSGKNYMTLHALPMYGSHVIYSKYKALLPKTNFQKGCINFKNEDEMPLNIIKQLIQDCSKIDLLKIREAYQKSKKERSKAK